MIVCPENEAASGKEEVEEDEEEEEGETEEDEVEEEEGREAGCRWIRQCLETVS